jgi:hypothetical protein
MNKKQRAQWRDSYNLSPEEGNRVRNGLLEETQMRVTFAKGCAAAYLQSDAEIFSYMGSMACERLYVREKCWTIPGQSDHRCRYSCYVLKAVSDGPATWHAIEDLHEEEFERIIQRPDIRPARTNHIVNAIFGTRGLSSSSRRLLGAL